MTSSRVPESSRRNRDSGAVVACFDSPERRTPPTARRRARSSHPATAPAWSPFQDHSSPNSRGSAMWARLREPLPRSCGPPAWVVLESVGRVDDLDDVRPVGVHDADVLVVVGGWAAKGALVLAHEEDLRA